MEEALDRRVMRMVTVRGGDVASSFRVDLSGGDRLFAKTHPSPPAGFFTTEAAGLAWLGDAGAGAGTIGVPTVVAVSDGSPTAPAFLVLEWIEEGRPVASTDPAFGEALATLHDEGAPCFGREDRRTTGSRGLPNDPQSSWSAFYATCRLVPLARLARDNGSLPESAVTGLERLAGSLDRFDDGEASSRLHGDLWAGNRLVDTSGRNWLIDPAAHGGHREFDLAMMRLFGGFSPATFHAYDERHPLRPGWEDRVPLHQIAPLVVHAIKFGGSYVAAATAAIARY